MTTPEPRQPRPPKAADAQQPAQRKAIRYGPTSNIIYRFQKRVAGCWVLPAAMLAPYRIVERILADLIQSQGYNIRQVTKVLLDRYEGENRVYITPTHHEDSEGIEIKRSKGGDIFINLITALWEEDLLQPTNQKQRFELETVPASQSPSGHPCLLLDLGKPRETRYIKKSPRKKNTNKKKQDEMKKPDEGTTSS